LVVRLANRKFSGGDNLVIYNWWQFCRVCCIIWACGAKRRQWLGEEMYEVWSGRCQANRYPKKTSTDIVQKDCQAHKFNREDAMDR